jgi:hypothetical protein
LVGFIKPNFYRKNLPGGNFYRGKIYPVAFFERKMKDSERKAKAGCGSSPE